MTAQIIDFATRTTAFTRGEALMAQSAQRTTEILARNGLALRTTAPATWILTDGQITCARIFRSNGTWHIATAPHAAHLVAAVLEEALDQAA